MDPIKETDLAVAASLFPPVECKCDTCNGAGHVQDPASIASARIPCPTCEGAGHYFRQMDTREEHFYILHLLTTRYQLR